ncbi:MAG TPA: hypothetical protein VH187_22690 [Scandinavium sp.]|jgi:hypothetical protein|uniref:hypothetical protein n=1 Tax=Scandinavium sp. TaxID=2830653 RepID=UPI002E369FB2|nr:hypothetical protein [Scandinavium sp.]HEX4503943.1 hypothetical protein [Scandinavium sp.]
MKWGLIMLLSLCGQAFGYVDLDQKMIVLNKSDTRVTLTNKGERTEFIQLSLAQLTNPGVEVEQEKLIPLTEIAEPAVYAFPLKMTLQPGQSKKIIIRRLKPVVQEDVYRLIITPKINLRQDKDSSEGSGVVLNIGYKALLRVLPEVKKDTFSVVCDPQGGKIIATGTLRHIFEKVSISGKNVSTFNVYPGTPYSFQGKPLHYDTKDYCMQSM